jgi:hypothetical protein
MSPEFFARQAAVHPELLLRPAKVVKDPKLSVGVVTKAADLGEKAEDATQSTVTPALRDDLAC